MLQRLLLVMRESQNRCIDLVATQGGTMTVATSVEDPAFIKRILDHLQRRAELGNEGDLSLLRFRHISDSF